MGLNETIGAFSAELWDFKGAQVWSSILMIFLA